MPRVQKPTKSPTDSNKKREGERTSSFNKLVVLILSLDRTWIRQRLGVCVQDLVLLLDQLVCLANLVSLNGLCKGMPEDLAAVAGTPLGIIGVCDLGIGGRGRRRALRCPRRQRTRR